MGIAFSSPFSLLQQPIHILSFSSKSCSRRVFFLKNGKISFQIFKAKKKTRYPSKIQPSKKNCKFVENSTLRKKTVPKINYHYITFFTFPLLAPSKISKIFSSPHNSPLCVKKSKHSFKNCFKTLAYRSSLIIFHHPNLTTTSIASKVQNTSTISQIRNHTLIKAEPTKYYHTSSKL